MAKYINVDEFSKRLQHISGTRLDCSDTPFDFCPGCGAMMDLFYII